MTWVIGDIHGMLSALKRLIWSIEEIYEKPKETKLIFLGDYIDYGPSSKELIDFIMGIPCEKVLLMGNHEDMLLDFLNDGLIREEYRNMWFGGNGGQETIKSFNPEIRVPREYRMDDLNAFQPEQFPLDKKYLDFFNSLKYSHIEQIGKYKFLFTHAGLNDEFDIDKQLSFKNQKELQDYAREERSYLTQSIVWGRLELKKKVKDYILIHGHTPTSRIRNYYKRIHGYDQDSNVPFFQFILDENQEHEPEFLMPKGRLDDKNCFRWRYGSMKNLISINIDTGAVMGKALTALLLDERDLNKGDFYMKQILTSEGFYTTMDDTEKLPLVRNSLG